MKNKLAPAVIIIGVIVLAGFFRNRIDFGWNTPTVFYFLLLAGLTIFTGFTISGTPIKKRFWGYMGIYAIACVALAVIFAL